MIRFKNVFHSYGSRNVLNDLSFSIDDGAFLGITGPSGSGKTTLCRLIAGLFPPSSGDMAISGTRGFVMQFPENQIFGKTVIDDVMFGPLNIGMEKSKAREAAETALKMTGIPESLFGCNPLNLSGGEKRRVAIAGVLAMDCDILILDEPAAGLDETWHDRLFEILAKLNEAGKTIVLVSHNPQDIAEHCTSVLCLGDGKTDFGPVHEVFPRHDDLRTTAMETAELMREKGLDPGAGVVSCCDFALNVAGLISAHGV